MANQKKSSDKILYLLKTRGDQTATQLGELLDMTMMGARKLLQSLEADGLVDNYQQAEGRGRPKLFWALSDKGHARFPDRHADLTLSLISGISDALGDEAMEKLISIREQQSLDLYRQTLAEYDNLAQKVEALADIRTQEGYMAESQKQPDGSFLLIENHCPICAAAEACQGFCRSELEIFRQCLGVHVERVEYMLEASRRCAYRIAH